jgi:hypothetical protein
MIAQALNAYITALVDVDGDRDRWTNAYVQRVQQQVYDLLYRLGRFQALIDSSASVAAIGSARSVRPSENFKNT